ncbi:hypothetical protein [Pelagicoccus sp. SDUM812002]|uniref:hypothetical protein n=1 Tax=Pelagicoccus sp. SDUM812002 TaxID=3041266 RepID=UPI0028106FCD|nr:hypothetical protein [Pelagicoccus sp. SDUM812002]MDQ8184471.1 hypothetical protein [Pelagicoccus sp. SDUM812002]
MVAVQLLDAKDGRLVAQIEKVHYAKSAPLKGSRSDDGKRFVYSSAEGILVVDTNNDEFDWVNAIVRNDGYLPPDGRYFAFTSRLLKAPEKILDLAGKHSTVELKDFVGFRGGWVGAFYLLFSQDGRSFYAISERNGVERWDFLCGEKLADYEFEPMLSLRRV